MPRKFKRILNAVMAAIVLIGAYLFIAGVLPGEETVSASSGAEAIEERFLLEAIDCGQADSILAVTPDGHTLLIDAGEDEDSGAVLKELKAHKVDDIDMLVMTHPHADHIGGMQKVLEQYAVGKVLLSGAEHTTDTYINLLESIKKKGVPMEKAKPGGSYEYGALKVKVLGPLKDYEDLNNTSVVLHLTYGNTRFLLMGDAEKQAEKDMLARYGKRDLKADVLKVAHHGSKTSTTGDFLAAVKPAFAVISTGANDCEHPNPAVVNRLKKDKVAVYRTDESGSVCFYSDGETLKVGMRR